MHTYFDTTDTKRFGVGEEGWRGVRLGVATSLCSARKQNDSNCYNSIKKKQEKKPKQTKTPLPFDEYIIHSFLRYDSPTCMVRVCV